MKLPVHRSVPVKTIITSDNGNTIAAIMRISPGAFAWYCNF